MGAHSRMGAYCAKEYIWVLAYLRGLFKVWGIFKDLKYFVSNDVLEDMPVIKAHE